MYDVCMPVYRKRVRTYVCMYICMLVCMPVSQIFVFTYV
jgi:hypothetical protein